jgi:anti-anti-sigma factor
MESKFTKVDNKNVLSLLGEFTIYAVSEFKQKIDSTPDLVKSDLYIDLSKVTRIDTSGIQALISIKKLYTNKGLNIHLMNHSEAMIAMIELYGLMAFFGDQLKLKKEDLDKFPFKYGRKKGYY